MIAGPTVNVFIAGEHFSGMEKEKPTESKELVETLLNRAGYTKNFEWECRVDKQKHCSSMSRPIRLVGFKNYGIIMRVKPYVHSNYDYQMTLYIPQGSGYSAKNLFDQLKANEKSVSRIIRQQEHKEKKTMEVANNHVPPAPSPFPKPVVAEPVVESDPEPVVTEYRPDFKTLQGVLKHNDKLRYVLQKIQTVNGLNFCRNVIQFKETLKHECKWDKDGHTKNAVTRVLTELTKSDYLMETVNDREKLIGYSLTPRAIAFITRTKDDSPLPELPAPKKEEIKVKVDILTTLVNMRDKLQELADVANKITSNNAEKAELLRKVAVLDSENEELSKVIGNNKECQEVLNKLERSICPLAMQT